MVVVAKVLCLLVAFIASTTPAIEAAIRCDDVTLNLLFCMNYLRGVSGPTSACCKGVRYLNVVAQTPQDRKAICNCIKIFIGSVHGLISANAAALPDKCGVRFPYPISPKTNCSKAH